ncbi:MAG TPA: pyridoxal-phosphate dependent enzyme [Planctomycetes bacterium]|nr:pyridoxal-phosphate dependent enzyme [Planctomycetota bacterium]
MEKAWQECINPDCKKSVGLTEALHRCPSCGELLDVRYAWDRLEVPGEMKFFEKRWGARRNPLDFSGVWRFRELMPYALPDKLVTMGEGQTLLRQAPNVADYANHAPGKLYLQYEGLNPTGSFKDNGMAGAFTHARIVGAKVVACASAGNTSASMAAFAAAMGGIKPVVFVGSGKIALGKLSQALDYGALTLEIEGDFDDAMARVQEVSISEGIYLMNSLNPFRLEGQKAIMYRVLEGLGWEPPDWVIVPGGNLGNSSAFGKAFIELGELGLVKKIPRLAVINASGANTLSNIYNKLAVRWNGGRYDKGKINGYYGKLTDGNVRAHTIASAIEINRPVNLSKCLRALEFMKGVVRDVPDEAILDAKAVIARSGIGCEPASAASVAGLKLLREEGVIGRDESVSAVLTGHHLKAPEATIAYHSMQGKELERAVGVKRAAYANKPVRVKNDVNDILMVLSC